MGWERRNKEGEVRERKKSMKEGGRDAKNREEEFDRGSQKQVKNEGK